MIKPNEKNWLIRFSIIIIFFTTLPYLIAYARQGNEWEFTGFVFGVEDGNSYIAKMLIGSSGDWLFRTPYTTYPQRGFLAFLPYMLLGKIASPPGQHDQLVVLMHFFRWLSIVFLIFSTYEFSALFLQNKNHRQLAVVIATIGGGLGWLTLTPLDFLWQGRLPLEFYSPETFGFLSILGLPHLALGRGFFLKGFTGYLSKFQGNDEVRNNVSSGIWWFALGFMQPLTIVSGWIVLLAHLITLTLIHKFPGHDFVDNVIRRNYYRRAVTMITLSSPMVIYNFIAFFIDPYLAGWSKQNIILSPPFLDYLLAYAFFLPFIIIAIFQENKSHNNRLFLIIWTGLLPVLIYSPYNLQRRLPEGIFVAICILAISSLTAFPDIHFRWFIRVFSLSLLTTLLILLGSCLSIWIPNTPQYRPKDEILAYNYIADNLPHNQIILANKEISNVLPAWVKSQTIIGHGPESIKQSQIQPIVQNLFLPSFPDDDRKAFLSDNNISLIILSPEEELSARQFLSNLAYLKPIYSNNHYEVIQVNLPANPAGSNPAPLTNTFIR